MHRLQAVILVFTGGWSKMINTSCKFFAPPFSTSFWFDPWSEPYLWLQYNEHSLHSLIIDHYARLVRWCLLISTWEAPWCLTYSYIITDNEVPSAIDFSVMIISSSIIGIFGQICYSMIRPFDVSNRSFKHSIIQTPYHLITWPFDHWIMWRMTVAMSYDPEL